jgi:hypothetical protein
MPYAKCSKLLRYRVNLQNRLGSLLPNLLDQIRYDHDYNEKFVLDEKKRSRAVTTPLIVWGLYFSKPN